ncbi:MAG TPA: sigma-70 family RNA polymerase sigma factor [Verrucomicrobiae bacterium]|nr:sigma-70 family RNA polymerase sigma factor [Verrucomicrobiae bacterium]
MGLEAPEKAAFSTTQWTVVMQSMSADPDRAQAALEKLCRRYWYPAYAFLRQRGLNPHKAEDLTQAFFYSLLSRRAFDSVNPKRGRFRSFLLTSLTNFLYNEHDREQARKRGGRSEIISFDHEFAEALCPVEPMGSGASPEKRFDRGWALLLARRALDDLRKEFEDRDRGALFSAIREFLTGEPCASDYEKAGLRLGMEPSTVKVSVHRARRRFGELLRREVAYTVNRPEDIEDELRHLLAAIAE